MNNNIKYNIFLLISNLSRNLVELFSILLLYKLGYSINNIFLYYIVFFFFSCIVNIITIYLTNYIKCKYLLIISNILFCFSYYFLNIMDYNIKNLIIFALVNAISSYMYHSIRHYYAVKHIKLTNSEIGNTLIYSFIGIIIASYFGSVITTKYSLFTTIVIMFILSIISIIPIILIKDTTTKEKIINIKINKERKLFFIFEQSKVLFLLIEPLYLFLYIESNIEYIGIFNIISNIACIVMIYYFARKINVNKYFKLLNILFVIVLIFKLNIDNKYLMLCISFFEGLFVKMYDIVSMKNLYQITCNNIKSYIVKCEVIFCFIRGLFMLFCYLFISDIRIILYILAFFILLSGIIKKVHD